jgi:hypothetical protein
LDYTGKETTVTNRRQTRWRFPTIAFVAMALLADAGYGVFAQQPAATPELAPAVPREVPLNIKIDPKTPIKDLLPAPPKARKQTPSAFVEELADVPELMLTEPIAPRPDARQTVEAVALQIARVNQLNKQKPDGLVAWMANQRPDLAGLPFQMGNDCRQSRTRSRYFKQAVSMVHGARANDRAALMNADVVVDPKTEPQAQPVPVEVNRARRVRAQFVDIDDIDTLQSGDAFLVAFLKACIDKDNSVTQNRVKEHREHAASARLAAMTQICAPTSDNMKLAMARYIASVSSVDSTRALVKTILFTPEEDARNVAIEALKARRDKDYVDLLLQGFRYPWPDVSRRAAEALVKLDRKDLVPRLIEILDEPDPRAPVTKTVDGKTQTTVREIVRINHHRNCLMCHAPGHEVQGSSDILTAETPVPGQALPVPSEGGYGSLGFPELLVRIDVTYLRQDFSMLLPVADAAPWPEMQRFDFVARTRVLNDDELQAYKEKFDKLESGVVPPNHRSALFALRELTGKEAAPTAEAWRKVSSAAR